MMALTGYQKTKRWRERHPERARATERNQKYKKLYKIDYKRYQEMLEEQYGVCAICLKSPESGKLLHVDHCHAADMVRGLLCSFCNTGIGLFGEDITLLEAAIRYLQRWAK